jgi:recombinational DNA repair ATPase RecF
MHLRRLSIAGYRSFSPEAPFVLEGLGRVNVLLGPNGVGKSNVGRFAAWVASISHQGQKYAVQFQVSESSSPTTEFAEALAQSARGGRDRSLNRSVRDAIAVKLRRNKYVLAREVAAIASRLGARAFTPEALTWAKQLADAIRKSGSLDVPATTGTTRPARAKRLTRRSRKRT